MRPCASPVLLALALWLAMPARAPRAADDPAATATAAEARVRSEKHYRAGLELFEAGNREQALIEFQIAHELFASDDIVFMMAQCEYHLGRVADARTHYLRYLGSQPEGPLAETARLRIAAIDRRPSVFVINSAPDDVRVQIDGEGQTFTGEAPNQFLVPRGRYRITVGKTNYMTEVRDVEIGIAETKSLFFGLRPVPARLTVRTVPRDATLFVRGMRAENPYVQDVDPGDYQIYAEAKEHAARRDTIQLAPGEVREVVVDLQHVPRSGRPELIGFWTVAGAAAGAGAVLSLLEKGTEGGIEYTNPASGSLIAAGAGAGALTGLLLSNAFTPDYIQDNIAVHRISHLWIGAAEGVLTGLSIERSPVAGWFGGTLGLGIGAVTGAVLDRRAPDYGRIGILQSGAAIGLLAGGLAVPAFEIGRDKAPLSVLVGLNVGLLSGMTMAYLPDQRRPGPDWRRVLLVDLGGLAGAFAGAVATTVRNCIDKDTKSCSFDESRTTARWTLAGGALGLVAGWLLTSDALPRLPGPDRGTSRSSHRTARWLPSLGAMPVTTADGRVQLLPGLVATGGF